MVSVRDLLKDSEQDLLRWARWGNTQKQKGIKGDSYFSDRAFTLLQVCANYDKTKGSMNLKVSLCPLFCSNPRIPFRTMGRTLT